MNPSTPWPTSATTPLSCTACGASIGASDRFCQQCGRSVSPAAGELNPADHPELSHLNALIKKGETSPAKRRRRRKHQRPRYLNAFVAAPIALLLALMVVGGSAMYRIQGTVGTLNSLSALPATITDRTLPEAVTESGMPVTNGALQVDTSAAREALRADQEGAGGGFLNNLRREAGELRDVASGAAIATGLRQPTAEPVTIMFVGTTVEPGAAIDIGNRPGVLMVLHLNPDANSCRGLVVPSNALTELPGYGQSSLNHALMVGGIPFQQLVLEDYLGIEIDHYALLESTGFRDLVESVGGITVTVEPEFASPAIPAGTHQVSGDQALEHYRFAGNDDDATGRVERQQHVIEGLIASAQGASLLGDSLDLMSALETSVRTSFDTADAASFAQQHEQYCTADAFELDTIPGDDVSGADPILQQDMTYHVADDVVVTDKVTTLLQGDDGA